MYIKGVVYKKHSKNLNKDLKFILYYTLYVCLLLGEVGRWMLGHAVSAVIS